MEQEEIPNQEQVELQESLSRANIWLGIFLILFLLSLGLLVYFQFYQGNGNWKFTLQHKDNVENVQSTDTVAIRNLKSENDSMIAIINSTPAKATSRTPDVYYSLQIAAFDDANAASFSNAFTQEQWENTGKVSKLTLGIFTSYAQAIEFQNALAKKGIKGWLIKRVHGKRQEITTADKNSL